MAIVKFSGGALAKQPGVKHPAKAAKHAVKKHAAKKHAAKHAAKKYAKKAAKHAGAKDAGAHLAVSGDGSDLDRAFHHLQRAAAVISLVEAESGADLRSLLEDGVAVYREAAEGESGRERKTRAKCAAGLLRAAEHLGMAGLYAARRGHAVEVPVPSRKEVDRLLDELGPRLAGAGGSDKGRRLAEVARELLRRAGAVDGDVHLAYELAMAAAGLCTALETGL